MNLDDEAGPVELYATETPLAATSWSTSGEDLLFYEVGSGRRSIMALKLEDGTARYILNRPFNERAPQLFRDGRWIAYVSDESGQDEVYVRPFQEGGSRTQISLDGGHSPKWSPVDTKLFYVADDRMMAAELAIDSSSMVTTERRRLFDTSGYYMSAATNAAFDIAPDGQRFLMLTVATGESDDPGPNGERINVILNFFEELKQRVPTGR